MIALVTAACGGGSTPVQDPLAGVYSIGGGDAAIPVVQAVAAAFAAKQLIDLVMASRDLTLAESEIVDRVLVGVAGTGLVVHQSNTLKDLTTAQVESIYSGKVSD